MNFLKVFIVSFIVVMLPMTLWNAIDMFVLNNCDHKFGCLGGFQIGLLVLSAVSFLSAVALSLAYCLLLHKAHSAKINFIHLSISGLLLSCSSMSVLRITDSSMPNMIVSWFFYSFVIGLATFYISKNITRSST
jgi:hypothetical protein